jgi:hypothetical protein
VAARDGPVLQTDDRLKEDLDFAAVERPAPIRVETDAIRAQDNGPCAVAVLMHEGLIDLDRIERKALQISQGSLSRRRARNCRG